MKKSYITKASNVLPEHYININIERRAFFMSYKYVKQDWESYDKTVPTRLQENSIITKERIEHIEEGIQKNSMPLVIGDLSIGDSAIPSANFEEDEEAEEIRLNIVFPKQSQIEDNTIKDDATWSSRKIRNEIDNIAANVRYTCEISSDEGLIFNTSNDVKTLRARIYMTSEDITASCDENSMVWYRKSTDTDYDDFWNGKAYKGNNVVISAAELNGVTSVTYYCSYSGINSEGATISAVGSVTVCNMIYEAVNTSISFNIDTPNGTIFDNKSDSTVLLVAQAYQGSLDLTSEASFRWYMNGVWIPEKTSSSLSYPVVGIALVTIFTCEMSYGGMTYKSSVTIQNRKNVTVSDTQPNDPNIGDIWYDVTVDMYKKWTSDGWVVIEDPTTEITGDVLLSVSAIKTVQETDYELKELRQATYTMKDDLETTITNYTNEFTSRADGIEQSFTETRQVVDSYDERITTTEQNISTIKATAETFEVNITKKVEDLENSTVTDSDVDEIREASAKASIDAEKIYFLIEKGSDETNLTLTSEFMSVLTGNVVIDAKKIDLRGYTTINDDGTGGFTIDETGYMTASKGGQIGPWLISDESLYMNTEEGDSIYLGKRGLNLSDKIQLSPSGGIIIGDSDNPNFTFDPLFNSISLNAEEIRLGGIDVATINSKIGVRNLILTSGAYKEGKTTFWTVDELPWSVEIGPENDGTEDTNSYTATETYISFTKLDNTEGAAFIRLPLSEVPTSGKHIFNIKSFTTGTTNPALNIYLFTEDNTKLKIGEISALSTRSLNVTFTCDLVTSASTEYKYVGFDCSEFAIGDVICIVNMSLYKSEVTIREWQPAPEDSVNDFNYLSDSLDSSITDVVVTISDTKKEITTRISNIFQSDDWESVKKEFQTTETSNGVTMDFITTVLRPEIDKNIGFQSERIDLIHSYIDFIDGFITLGNNSSPFKLKIGNDKMSFLQNDVYELAYFSTNKLFVAELEPKVSMQLGKFKFFPRSNGNLSIAMVGSSS